MLISGAQSHKRVAGGQRRVFTKTILAVTAILLSMLAGFSHPFSVAGQGDQTLIVLPPDCADFPVLATQIKPRLVPGVEAVDLRIEDLTVRENGQAVEVLSLEKEHGGVHFTLAINGDRRLDIRDAEGESPYDRIRLALNNWAAGRRFSPGDTLSLVTQEGAPVRNTSDRGVWMEALNEYQPNFRAMTPDLASLETALRLSAERVVPFGVDKALLYITPPPSPEEIIPLAALTETARAAEIQVHVWMLGEDFYLSNDQGAALINLAAITGGQFFHYTGVEALPDPASYLEGIGVYYNLTYTSSIREEGTYRITIQTTDGQLRGESGDFYLDVQPPKPILLSPPSAITRTAPQGWDGSPQGLTPPSIPIEFMLEFPDHYVRDLAVSRLLVDGRVVDERTEAPFDPLTWDITALDEPGEYALQVWVEDTLGLSGETILTPIQVSLVFPETEPRVSIETIGVMAVRALLGAAALLLIIWGLRRLFKTPFAQRLAKKLFEPRPKTTDHRPVSSDQHSVPYATLLPLSADNTAGERAAVDIRSRHTSFGSDPKRADLALDGAGIAGLHARLRAVDGKFWLSDCGTTEGTWINYERIGGEPVQLHPGDLIHFGSVGFRFTIINEDAPPTATVKKYDLLL
ncbi:MAG: FHA domain-containing protein [Brevefilum sp.]